MSQPPAERLLDIAERPSVADVVFDDLHARILRLDLAPGAKLSEAEVARQAGVSRQPVRDAFYRLSQLGFLSIRPQRATLVTHISTRAVRQARFLRTAVEVETVRTACARLDATALDQLDENLARQKEAVAAGDKTGFHQLDDRMHQTICALSGLDFAWEVIHVQKAHMDRVRYLSLAFASQTALSDHVDLLAALRARDEEGAVAVMRTHLGRIEGIIDHIRADNAAFFAEEDQ